MRKAPPRRGQALDMSEMENKKDLPEEEGADLMTLEDEDGNEVTFEVVDALDHDGEHYMAVVEYADPESTQEADDQVVILHVGKDEDGEYLDVVDDDEQLLTLGKLFEKRLADQYDIQP